MAGDRQAAHRSRRPRRQGQVGPLELGPLTVRPWRVGDARALDRAVNESVDHLRPWMPWARQEPVGLRRRRAFIRSSGRSWRRGTDYFFGAFLGDRVAGAGGLHTRIGPGGLEIGYWIHRDEAGRGLATELAAGLTSLGFSWADVERIEIHHDEANVASRRVPEKLGFTLVDRHPDPVQAPAETGICCVWRVERAAWHDPFDWSVGGSPP